jgi:hypothetical protein
MASMPGIYVEIRMGCAMDDLWSKTQSQELLRQWDLRFTAIEYLPRPDASQPQRFVYATRVGFGLRIAGKGESVGSHEGDGSRTSALKFWSDDFKSLIREGSGYWQYTHGRRNPFSDVVRLSTCFGVAGRVFDTVRNRTWGPLFGYSGTFETEWFRDVYRPPKDIEPVRFERRE